ncbi:MAG: PEGA domain-containing protein [Lachnospiraceae bacterium]
MKILQTTPNNRMIRRTLTLFLSVFCLAFFLTSCGKEVTIPSYDEEVMPADEISMFAIVCNLDEVNEKITLQAVNFETEITLNYTAGADVRDKYGDILPISKVELGSIVDIVYDANRDKLESLYLSADENIRKLEAVSGAEIDYLKDTVKINGVKYQMSDSVCAFSDNNEIGINEICSEDQLSVWLYNDIVCTFYVELGHGYVKLSDYASYIGGMVEIGYDVIVPVTEDMLLTVREGKYTLRIAKGDDVGTKTVEVIKNQEINVSLADIAIEPKETGSVLFKVTPSDAAVYIDKKRVNTEGAVDIVYGKHKIDIIADGYESYSASFNVNYAYKIKEYTLQKKDETDDGTNGSTNTTSGSTTATTEDTNATTEAGTTEGGSTEDSSVKDVTATEDTKTSNKVTISAPSGASVYFDGEYLGIAPISFTKVTGSHIITFSKLGYLSKSYTVTFTDDGEDASLKYDELISISSLIE